MTARRASVALVSLALVPASAGASAAPRPVALTATPARVLLAGTTAATVRVTNSGSKAAVVDVSRAGFRLDLHGRPRIVPIRAGSAADWLTLRPGHFSIGPRSTASLVVSANVPRGAEPGDHDALAVLQTRPVVTGPVAVRLRLGVIVIVRAPGEIVRRLELRRLRVSRGGSATLIEATVANLGNVTESLHGVRAAISRLKDARVVAGASAASRDVRPRTSGVITFRFRPTLRGPLTVRVVIPADGGRSRVERRYWIRL